MSDKGFIVIDRKITEWKWWGNVYAMSIWLYILMSANWKDGHWAVTGETVNRGSFITSLSRMAKELSLDRRTIKHWLDVFKSDGQIDFACTRQCTRITVIKYGFYQDHDSDHVQPNVQPDVHNRTKKQSNKETIVIKENIKRKFVKPTIDELSAYAEEIQYYSFDPQGFYDYYESKGWMVGKNHMKDWKATVRNWKRNDSKNQMMKGEARLF